INQSATTGKRYIKDAPTISQPTIEARRKIVLAVDWLPMSNCGKELTLRLAKYVSTGIARDGGRCKRETVKLI
ncbi:hypothetical protein QUB34_18610, partial [Microcoleus sp. AT9b-C5]